ncbi:MULTISPECIES: pentapeptide repeat-containing protein [Streptomyces]|uniref:pentapeptide repeat-containing protein n=1 Tax=Streptomyces TaxID=1883 RepID=UPI00211ACA01|nr:MULTISPECIES: pentapeptide repeat-containing protein [Streptomyces]MDX3629743.1 pentapeptide repeat-containing protein [Streptomyces europaeiscabiei]MDX3648360.1 pentapeptide repeat-containing protein [Streptomyces europaeiscabiei]
MRLDDPVQRWLLSLFSESARILDLIYLYFKFRVRGRTRGFLIASPKARKYWTRAVIALTVILFVSLGFAFQIWGQAASWVNDHMGVDLRSLKPDEKAAARGQLRLAVVQSLVAVGAMVALRYTARTYRLTMRGQVTDRFTKALERLSAEKEYVRIGGILALGQILHDARDQSEDAQTVLQNFISDRTPEAGDGWAENEEPTEHHAPEVQTALDTLGAAARNAAYRLRLADRCLVRLNFMELQLVSADLRRSDLRKADLEKVNFWGALLDYVDLRLCDMRGAIFVDSSMRAVRLQYARMEGASFDRAFLKYAVFSDASSGWSTRDVSFRHAFLSRAKMVGYTFMECDFRNADLSGADMRNAVLQKCRFSKVDLQGTDLRGADLRGALGLTARQLEGARTDEHTRYPLGLVPAIAAASASPAAGHE